MKLLSRPELFRQQAYINGLGRAGGAAGIEDCPETKYLCLSV
jgi:hypothetical protein